MTAINIFLIVHISILRKRIYGTCKKKQYLVAVTYHLVAMTYYLAMVSTKILSASHFKADNIYCVVLLYL
jgi:hypothetical protein